MRMITGVAAVAPMVLGGCQSGDNADAAALQTAYERGQIEMSCPEATPTITSRDPVQPVDPNAQPAPRVDYTVNVSGCGESLTRSPGASSTIAIQSLTASSTPA